MSKAFESNPLNVSCLQKSHTLRLCINLH